MKEKIPRGILIGCWFLPRRNDGRYAKHYNMYTYVTKELESVCKSVPEINERVDFERQSIMGHSMGGHGALTIGRLRNPRMARQPELFAPIANPSAEDCPWGQKASKGT